ncbi:MULTISPECIES: GspH/FimT family pseudopilin [Pseudomonas]|uniref:GspH/FimT family pseudopilin n=1 Tax=Pseudomonas TaxID=286 RepID=UPI000EFA5B8E|nr:MULTISPECIES: GspH/FimT family pseudopilin [Pseudomonas]AYN97325.1 prepilin-type N-terminal cleavage/methylation domain-containing protein [Pseudomonas sp. LTJR-52]MCG7372582.1 GspH/FimT family pseudopilin [Pseudomonas luteola]
MLRYRGSLGFTLIELMVVVALVAVVATIAMPQFSLLIQSNQVQSTSNELYGALMYTRGEAVARGVPVTITAPSADGWTQGLKITSGSETLRDYSDTGLNQQSVNATGTKVSITFGPLGIVTKANGAVCTQGNCESIILICSKGGTGAKGKKITIEQNGNISSPTDAAATAGVTGCKA